MLTKQSHVVPIPGTKRSKYVIENAAAADITLTAQDVSELDNLFAPSAIAGDRYVPAGRMGIEASY
jgi:diketogulonate reductase-like aldo/keto reductase